MKNLFKAAVLMAAAGTMFSTTAMAETVTIPVDAEIVEALTLTKTRNMDFGTATKPTGSTGTVTLNHANLATGVGTTTSGSSSSGEFTVTGTSNAVTITFPGSVTMSNGTPAQDMLVDSFTHDYDGTSTVDTMQTIRVGGQLHLADGQASGLYSGSMVVTVNY